MSMTAFSFLGRIGTDNNLRIFLNCVGKLGALKGEVKHRMEAGCSVKKFD